jgi:hypothetical protein
MILPFDSGILGPGDSHPEHAYRRGSSHVAGDGEIRGEIRFSISWSGGSQD